MFFLLLRTILEIVHADNLEFEQIFVELNSDEFQFLEVNHQHIFVLMRSLHDSYRLAD